MEEKEEIVRIIDTSDSFTKEELRELKNIIYMSKLAKTGLAILAGFIALFGIDRIIEFITKLFKVS